MPRGIVPKSAWKPKLTPMEEVRVMELHVTQFLSFRQVADLWNRQHADDEGKQISHETVRRIVRRQLDEIAVEMKGARDALRERQSMMLEQAMRVVWTIAASTKCSVCNGEKTVYKDRLDPDLGVQVCPKCDGSGRNEDDATRVSAVNSLKGLAERQAKLYGLDAPIEIDQATTVHVALDVSGLSSEQIDAELEGMFKQPALEGVAHELPLGREDQLAEIVGSPDSEPQPSSAPADDPEPDEPQT
jgi:hypothetical protein